MPVLAPPPPAAICRTTVIASPGELDALRPLVATGPTGDGALVWGSASGDGPVHARVLRHGDLGSSTTTLAGGRVSGLRVSPAPGGGALLSFRRLSTGQPVVVGLSAVGRLGRRGVVSGGDSIPDVAARPDGSLRAVWIRAADPGGPAVLTATAASAAGPWSSPVVAARGARGTWGRPMAIGDAPRIVAIAGGRWVVAWRQSPAVGYAVLRPDGTPVAPPAVVGTAATGSAPPVLRASAAGAIMAWTESVNYDVHVTATRIGADGAHTSPVILSGPRADGFQPPVVLADARYALVAWAERAPGRRVARVVRVDMTSGETRTWATAPISGMSGIGGASAGGRAAIVIRQGGGHRRTRVLLGRLDARRASRVVTADAGRARYDATRAPAVAVTASGGLVVAADHWAGMSRAVLRLSTCRAPGT